MKRYIKSYTTHTSGCSFDFDLGNNYDSRRIENLVTSLFADLGLSIVGVDFRSVEYPHGKLYSQCGVDFEWQDTYDSQEIEDELIELIEDEGGNFFGIDFYSLDGVYASEDVKSVPQRLANLPYVFTLNSVNSTYNDDILEIAEHWGATKVKYQEINPKTGNLFAEGYWKLAVPSERAAENIFNDVKKARIPTHQSSIQVVKTNWNNNYNIWIDDYAKGKFKVPFNSKFVKK